ncbi:MAG: hypothetical protein WC802_05370 [Patescibacteria group bacterium]|jgi:hypothetical protein
MLVSLLVSFALAQNPVAPSLTTLIAESPAPPHTLVTSEMDLLATANQHCADTACALYIGIGTRLIGLGYMVEPVPCKDDKSKPCKIVETRMATLAEDSPLLTEAIRQKCEVSDIECTISAPAFVTLEGKVVMVVVFMSFHHGHAELIDKSIWFIPEKTGLMYRQKTT